MKPILYDLINLAGLAAIVIGIARLYGIDYGLIVGGIIMISLNLILLWQSSRSRRQR